jgi:hypothetical protein
MRLHIESMEERNEELERNQENYEKQIKKIINDINF